MELTNFKEIKDIILKRWKKGDILKSFKQNDFVKLLGQREKSIDDNDKEHTNVRILSFKLLKDKIQMKSQEEKKEASKEAER